MLTPHFTKALQPCRKLRWFLLDDQHADYAAIIAGLEAHADRWSSRLYKNEAGGVANTKLVRTMMTDDERDAFTPSLALDGGSACVLDEFNYKALWVEHEAEVRSTPTLPHEAEDLRREHALGLHSGDMCYVAQDNAGLGDGSSYRNRRRVKDFLGRDGLSTVTLQDYKFVVLCGVLSRFANEGADQGGLTTSAGFLVRLDGDHTDRTRIIAHPVDKPYVMQGCKHGNGSWGEDNGWTSLGGGAFKLGLNGTVNIYDGQGFAFELVDGVPRPLTKVSSSAACIATAGTWYAGENEEGVDLDVIYCHRTDGADPEETTFWPTNAGGVGINFTGSQGVDIIGVEQPGRSYRNIQSDHYRLINTPVTYVKNYGVVADNSSVNEGTGQFVGVVDDPQHREFLGVKWEYLAAGLYDFNGGHARVSGRTHLKWPYFHKIGHGAANGYGIENATGADSHCIANQGCFDWGIKYPGFRKVGPQTISFYVQSSNYAEPTGGLETQPGYTQGLRMDLSFDEGDGSWSWCGKVKNVVMHGGITREVYDASESATYSGSQREGFGMNGDASPPLWSLYEQYKNISYVQNIVVGAYNWGAVKLKFIFDEGDLDVPRIFKNIFRSGQKALLFYGAGTLGANSGDPSGIFKYNLVEGDDTVAVVHPSNYQNEENHLQVMDFNRYTGAPKFQQGGSGTINFATWQGSAPSGDTYDTNSVQGVSAITNLGAGTVTVTKNGGEELGTLADGDLLTARYNWDDPNGVFAEAGPTRHVSWQWYRGADAIAGAVENQYRYNADLDDGEQISVVARYIDVHGFDEEVEEVAQAGATDELALTFPLSSHLSFALDSKRAAWL